MLQNSYVGVMRLHAFFPFLLDVLLLKLEIGNNKVIYKRR